MNIKKINKLLQAGSWDDRQIAMVLIAKEIHEREGIDFAKGEKYEGADFYQLKAFDTEGIAWTRYPRVNSLPFGIAYKDFSLNIGGYHIVYARKGSDIYRQVLEANNHIIQEL